MIKPKFIQMNPDIWINKNFITNIILDELDGDYSEKFLIQLRTVAEPLKEANYYEYRYETKKEREKVLKLLID